MLRIERVDTKDDLLARAARDAAVEDWGLPHENVLWSPYWIAGQPRP